MSFDLLSERTQVSRRDRHCIWCGEPIAKGETYTVQTGKFYGHFQTNRYHPECAKAMKGLRDFEDGGFEAWSFKRGTTEEK